MVSGHGSGYCGGPTGFTTGDYVVSETRLGDVTASALGGSTILSHLQPLVLVI